MISKLPSPWLHLALAGAVSLIVLSSSPCLVSAAGDPYLIEVKKLTGSDGKANDEFGYSAAISGNTAVVGEFPHNGIAASAYLFERDAGGTDSWAQVKKFTRSGTSTGSSNFTSVAISVDTVVVGTSGEAQIFERNAGGSENWGLVKTLQASESHDNWGVSIAISGNTIVVGAGGAQRRAAYVYERNEGGANNWGLVKPRLLAGDSMPLDFFGNAVAIAGDTIVVGAPGGRLDGNPDSNASEHAGAGYVFERHAGGTNNWGEVRKLAASDGGRNDQFGSSVAIDGDVIAVGAHQDDIGSAVDQGSAYLFERNLGGAGNWGVVKKLTGSDGQSRNRFGTSIAVSGNKVVVGENQDLRRQIKIFERNQGGANHWGEFQKLNPTGSSNAIFGYSVGIDGGTVIVGARTDNVAGNTRQGSAYIFDSVTGPNPTIRGQVAGGSAGQTFGGGPIAAVSDDATPPGDLIVTVISSPPGIAVSNPQNDYGRVTGALTIDCAVPAGSYPVGLRVTDAGGLSATDNLIVNVAANTAPTLGDYPAARVSLGGSAVVIPSAQPSDNALVSTVSATAPGFTGNLTASSNGAIAVSNAGPPGDYTVTVTATDNCGLASSKTFALTVLGQPGLITVNTTADGTANDGACSLREAIVAANSNTPSGALTGECVAGLPGTDTIAFNIPGAGPHTIIPVSALPTITEPVIIDGFTQPGANGVAWPPTLKIGLNGGNAGGGANGLDLGANAVFSTVRGLVINGFGGTGVRNLANNTTIQGNFIGTDFTGILALGNGTGVDLGVQGNNLVGGGTVGARNLISGNKGAGVSLQPGSGGNKVQGNFIGTDVTGSIDLGNQGNGVTIGDLGGGKFIFALIGGPSPEVRNIISGNDQQGVFVQVLGGNVSVEGNFIGTDLTGTKRLGNSANGIWAAFTPFTGMVIGGDESRRNLISANGAAGVKFGADTNSSVLGSSVTGNYIGTDVTGAFDLGNSQDGVLIIGENTSGNHIGILIGTASFGGTFVPGNVIAFNGRDGVRVEANSKRNSIGYNSIFRNAGLALNLGSDGATANDPGDPDTGPNGLQNFPILTSVITNGNSTTIQGTLNSKPNSEYIIQFFSSAACGESGKAQGQVWLSENVVTTDASGNATINVSQPMGIKPGKVITATATPTNSSDPEFFSTSELSPCQLVEGIGASPPSQLLNISTRLRVLNGENVLIGGFIITGTDAKRVIIRGIGPSLAQFFNGTLDDPVVELHQGSTLLETNNNWQDNEAAIAATGIPPSHDLESAIVRTLNPGAYTAVLRSVNNVPGIGLVEAYDLDQVADSKLANISTRGFVDSGDNVMIGGFIIGNSGGGGATVVVRAIGPALGSFGIAGALQDPTLDLVDANGAVLRSNNDWQDSQKAEIEAAALPLGDVRESAVVQTLAPGNYTAIVRGMGNTTGVGLVEVYNLP